MRVLSLLLLLAIFKPVFSQDSLKRSYVFFRTKHVIAYVDGKKITPSHDPLFLKKGMHKIQAWAPTYRLLEDSFMVEKNNTFYSKKLKRSWHYRKYVIVKTLRIGSILVPATATGIYCLLLDSKVKDYENRMDAAKSQEIKYRVLFDIHGSNNPTYNKLYRDGARRYQESRKEYNRIKVPGTIVASGLAIASVAYLVFTCYQIKPYKETPLLSRITPMIDPFGKQAGLCFQLK